ncbi:MAG: methyltransferase domain-containing protein [Thermomicrobiales bacterium]
MATQQGTLTFDVEVGRKLEAIYATPDAVTRRRAALDAVQAQPGENGLDIGPGPGFLACELARQVGPTGRVATVDNNPTMLAMTQQRALDQGLSDRIDLHQSDAATLPFPDGAFDFVVASQVYEYVAGIEQALAEAWRVLRPGGRLVIIDTDWDTLVIHADDVELTARINRAWDEHLAHRTLPQRLPSLLSQAGFKGTVARLVPVLSTEHHADTYGYGLIGLMANFARGRAGVDDRDVDSWLADIDRQNAGRGYFFSLNQYLFSATRPDARTGI